MQVRKLETISAGRLRHTYVFDAGIEWYQLVPAATTDETDPEGEGSWPTYGISIRVEETADSMDSRFKCTVELDRLLQSINSAARDWIQNARAVPADTRHGTAAWATPEELKKADYLVTEPDSDRFLIGRYGASEKSQLISLPAKQTERHALICGPTGSGKTRSIFIPNLIERVGASAVVTESTSAGITPDLLTETSRYRMIAGHRICYFNPLDLRSDSINPLDLVRTIGQAQDLADIIIRNTTTNNHVGDQVWETSERQLLTALVMLSIHDRSTATLANIRRMLTKGQKALKQIIEQGPAGKARDECMGMFNLSTEGFLNGVMVGLLVRLSPFLTPSIDALTSSTSIDLQKLPNELFTFYLAVPAESRQAKPVAALMLNFILDLVLRTISDRGTFPRPFMMLLDELTNFGYIPDLPAQLTILRHAHIPITLGFQDVEQLRKVYGPQDAKIILSQPATRVFFKPNDDETALKISNQLGTATRRDFARSIVYPRKLMTPDEVQSLPEERAICFLPGTRPVKFWRLLPGEYQDRCIKPPPLRDPIRVDDAIVPEAEPTIDLQPGAQEQVKGDYPGLFQQPQTVQQQDDLMARANQKRREKGSKYTRQRAKEILDRMSKTGFVEDVSDELY